MEIVNIEAKTFQEMLDALFDLEKEFKLLRNQHPNCQLNEWLDNQESRSMRNTKYFTQNITVFKEPWEYYIHSDWPQNVLS